MHTVKKPKHTIYMAASWNEEHEDMNLYVANLLVNKYGLIVIGDHRDYRDMQHERKLNYQERVDEILQGCNGMVLIFPKQGWPQTTSCRMFIEFLLATKHKLPILLCIEEGVEVKWSKNIDTTIFTFGESNQKNEKSICLNDIKKTTFNTSLLNDIHSIIISTPSFINDPVWLSSNIVVRESKSIEINDTIESFLNDLETTNKSQYVFLISPYSLSREREIIAETIFRETGLLSVNASDKWGGAPYSSTEIKLKLKEAHFVIANLTGIRKACVFEIGFAIGSDRQTYIVYKPFLKKLPFGVKQCPHSTYKDLNSLRIAVKDHCRAYRRRVFNNEITDSCSKSISAELRDIITYEPEENNSSKFPWYKIALWAGILFTLLAFLLLILHHWLPWPWNLIFSAIVTLGTLTTVLILMRDPRFFYRRLIQPVLWSGILINVGGFSLSALVNTSYGIAGFSWSGITAWSFNLAWLGIIAIFVGADIYINKFSPRRLG